MTSQPQKPELPEVENDFVKDMTLHELESIFKGSKAEAAIKEMRETIKQFAEELKTSHTDREGNWPGSEHDAMSEYMQLIRTAEG